MFARIHTWLERVARVAVWAGGAALMTAAIIVTGDVLSRKFLGFTMSGSDEISGYVFAAGTTWAYSYCLLHRANVRIDAFYNFMPRPVRAILDVLGVLLLLGFMGVLTRRAIGTLIESIDNHAVSITTLTTPLWIPQLAWVSGLIMFMITLVFVSAYAIVSLLRGDLATVRRVIGVLSVEEEIEEETRGTGARTSRRAREA